MKLLLNMNLPRSLVTLLTAHGHECRHVGDIGHGPSDDRAIVELARITAETILTHDLDYADILAFSGQSSPSVIIFRLKKVSPDNLAVQLARAWPRIEPSLAKGAIIIVSDNSVRIRPLPVQED